MAICVSLPKFFYGKESERVNSNDDRTGIAQ